MSKSEPSKPKAGGFKLKYVAFSLIPVIVLLIIAELLSSVVFYQMRGKNPLAIISVMQYVGKKIKGENTVEAAAARFIRLPEHRKSFTFTTAPTDVFMVNCDNLAQKEYTVRTDEDAFIMPSRVHENPDLVLAFMGGSTTECRFNEEEARFPYQVGRMVEQKTGKKVNSYNNGISSITSMNSLDIFINKVLPLQPDYAVMMHNINDMNVLIYEGTYWNGHPIRSLVVDPNNPRFFDEKYNTDEWADARGKPLTIDTGMILNNFGNSLKLFIATCKIWKVEPVLMTQANRFTEEPNLKILGMAIEEWKKNGLTYAQIKSLYDSLNQCVRETAASQQITLIDLAKEVPQTSEYMYDVVHYTDKGSMLAAGIISKSFTDKILAGTVK